MYPYIFNFTTYINKNKNNMIFFIYLCISGMIEKSLWYSRLPSKYILEFISFTNILFDLVIILLY